MRSSGEGSVDAVELVFGGSFGAARRLDLLELPDAAAGIVLIVGAHPGDRLGIWVDSGDVDGDLVRPGSPELSYLLEKVAAEEPMVGLRMPVGGALAEFEIEAIRQWIAGGAAP